MTLTKTWYWPSEVAILCCVSRMTVYRWIERGVISHDDNNKCVKIIRSEVAKLLNSQSIEDGDDIYTVKEIAEKLTVSRMTVTRWIWEGKIETTLTMKPYRVTHANLAKFVESLSRLAPHLRAMKQPKYGDRYNLWINQNGRCFYCCRLLLPRYHLDHIIPKASGGRDSIENYCLACEPCNVKKGARPAGDFVISLLSRLPF